MDISKKNVREYRKGNEKLSPKRNWQHRVHKTKKLATQGTQDEETGNIGYTRRRQTKQTHNTTQRNWQHRVHKTKTNKHTTQQVLDTTIWERKPQIT